MLFSNVLSIVYDTYIVHYRQQIVSPATTPVQLKKATTDSSQIDGPTPKNQFGFGFTQVNYDTARNDHEV